MQSESSVRSYMARRRDTVIFVFVTWARMDRHHKTGQRNGDGTAIAGHLHTIPSQFLPAPDRQKLKSSPYMTWIDQDAAIQLVKKISQGEHGILGCGDSPPNGGSPPAGRVLTKRSHNDPSGIPEAAQGFRRCNDREPVSVYNQSILLFDLAEGHTGQGLQLDITISGLSRRDRLLGRGGPLCLRLLIRFEREDPDAVLKGHPRQVSSPHRS